MTTVRVLIVTTAAAGGGVEQHLLSLVHGLDRQRFQVSVAAPAAFLEKFESQLATAGARVYPVSVENPFDVGGVRRLWALYRSVLPEIVHLHLFRAALVGAPLAKLAGVRVVIETCHVREAWRHRGFKASFAIDRLVGRSVDHFIAVSESVRDFVVLTKGYDRQKVRVIRNGRDLSAFRPAGPDVEMARRALGLDANTPTIGVIGRLDAQKGHRYLVSALPAILATTPHLRVVFVGEGPLRDDLRAQADRLGVANVITFAGFHYDVRPWIAAMDVVVLPSLYEGLPLVVIEALGMAKGIVATAVDGTQEVVRNEQTGLLVPPADSDALAIGIVRLLTDAAFRDRCGQQGRAWVEQHFDVKQMIKDTEQAYADALAIA